MNPSVSRPGGRLRKRFSGYLIPGLLLMAVLAIFVRPGNAQQLTGTLSGTVFDQSGAVVVGAHIVLKNTASGDLRQSANRVCWPAQRATASRAAAA